MMGTGLDGVPSESLAPVIGMGMLTGYVDIWNGHVYSGQCSRLIGSLYF